LKQQQPKESILVGYCRLQVQVRYLQFDPLSVLMRKTPSLAYILMNKELGTLVNKIGVKYEEIAHFPDSG
jgi:hypothetical protein